MKPKMFIGSSREGVKIADAIHFNLSYEAECTVWKDGVFQLSSNTLPALIDALRNSDFAVFVFSPDDTTVMRNLASNTVRDNVLFELGLFIGRLGQDRCFFLIPDDAADLRLPSDLAGVTPGRYESNRSDGNWMAALNPACMQIKMQMARLKPFQDAVIAPAPSDAVTAATLTAVVPDSPQGISAKHYKNSILVTGNTHAVKERLAVLGSWNAKLMGWVVPKSRKAKLLEEFEGLVVAPAEE